MSIDKYETLNQERKIQRTKRKVAAYCRVSTDNEDQANSFESQQRYFRQYIERNPDWELYAVIHFLGKSNADAAVQVMWRDIKPEKMEAAIRRGVVLKLQGMEALMWTKQGIKLESYIRWYTHIRKIIR